MPITIIDDDEVDNAPVKEPTVVNVVNVIKKRNADQR